MTMLSSKYKGNRQIKIINKYTIKHVDLSQIQLF